MGAYDLKREIRAVLKEAADAADHAGGSRHDLPYLQRLVARLKRTLFRLNRAHDELEIVYRALTEGMCRSNPLSDPGVCRNRDDSFATGTAARRTCFVPETVESHPTSD